MVLLYPSRHQLSNKYVSVYHLKTFTSLPHDKNSHYLKDVNVVILDSCIGSYPQDKDNNFSRYLMKFTTKIFSWTVLLIASFSILLKSSFQTKQPVIIEDIDRFLITNNIICKGIHFNNCPPKINHKWVLKKKKKIRDTLKSSKKKKDELQKFIRWDQQNTENKEKIRLFPSDHEINKKDSSCLLLVYLGVRELRSLNLGDAEVRIRASLLIPYDKNKITNGYLY